MRRVRKSRAMPGGICPFPFLTGLFEYVSALLKQPHGYSPPKYGTSNCREEKFSCSDADLCVKYYPDWHVLDSRDRHVELQHIGLSSQ